MGVPTPLQGKRHGRPSEASVKHRSGALPSDQRDAAQREHGQDARDHHEGKEGGKRDVGAAAKYQCRRYISDQCDPTGPVKKRIPSNENTKRRGDRGADES